MKICTLVVFILYNITVKAQIITTFAGSSSCGNSGDGGPATSAKIYDPAGGIFDKSWNYYFCTFSNTVRKVTPSGIIYTIAGTGMAGFSGDGGPATMAKLSQPISVALDADGNFYISDEANNRIRKIDTSGIITTFAGNGVPAFAGDGGMATAASLLAPSWVLVDDTGNIYDVESCRIRKVDKSGIIHTIVGNGVPGFSGDGGPASAAEIQSFSAFLDKDNNLFIADDENSRVRRVDAGTDIITIIAGTGTPGFSGDGGQATAAEVIPGYLAVDVYGNLFIANGSSKIRKVDPSGIITTFAGTGIMGYSGDNGSATDAQIYNPEGIAFDSCGNVYIADDANCRIRKITFPKCHYLGVENENNANLNLSIYPNPTYDQLNINNLKTPSTYHLLSIVGAAVQQGTLKEGNNTISILSIPNGMYMLEIIDEQKNRTVNKIIKE